MKNRNRRRAIRRWCAKQKERREKIEAFAEASAEIGKSVSKKMEESIFERMLSEGGDCNLSSAMRDAAAFGVANGTSTADMPTTGELIKLMDEMQPIDPELSKPIEMTRREYNALRARLEFEAFLRGEEVRTEPLTASESLYAVPIKIVEEKDYVSADIMDDDWL